MAALSGRAPLALERDLETAPIPGDDKAGSRKASGPLLIYPRGVGMDRQVEGTQSQPQAKKKALADKKRCLLVSRGGGRGAGNGASGVTRPAPASV